MTPVRTYISPRHVAVALAALVSAMFLIGIAVQLAHHGGARSPVEEAAFYALRLQDELNVGSWVSGMLLLTCAGLFATVALLRQASGGMFVTHWSLLAGLFMYLSLDEVASIKEQASKISQLPTAGTLNQWLLPAIALGLVLLLAYRRFLGHLPISTRALLFFAAALYAAGAMGLDALTAVLIERGLVQAAAVGFLSTVEETMELIGSVVVIYALLAYIGRYFDSFSLRLRQPGSGRERASAEPTTVTVVRWFVPLLAAAMAALFAGGLAVLVRYGPDFPLRDAFIEVFSFSRELSAQNWLLSSVLALAAGGAMLLGRIERDRATSSARAWRLGAAVLAYLSLEEVALIQGYFAGALARTEVADAVRVLLPFVALALTSFWVRTSMGDIPGRLRGIVLLGAALFLGGGYAPLLAQSTGFTPLDDLGVAAKLVGAVAIMAGLATVAAARAPMIEIVVTDRLAADSDMLVAG